LLIAKETEMRRRYDVRWRPAGIATRRGGWMADPDGFNPIAILNGHWPAAQAQAPRDVREWLEKARADVLIEASSLNAQTGQPATDHLRAALNLARTPSLRTRGRSSMLFMSWPDSLEKEIRSFCTKQQ
jgi:homoserine dehydrogenase